MTHTPAPWNVEGRKIRNHDYLPDMDNFHVSKDGKPLPKTEANANLIAAAPDMLEALKNLLNEIEEAVPSVDLWSKTAAIKAIAKAEGKQ